MFDVDGFETRLLCPVCKFDYSHLREAFTRFGTDELEGGHAYPGTLGKGTAPEYRRDGLVIVFDGECGHAWQLIVQHHKGNNFVHVRYAAQWNRKTPTCSADPQPHDDCTLPWKPSG